MLIDRTHKKWIYVCLGVGAAALVGHAWLNRHTPGGLTGGSTVGLWYGIAGSLLMIFAGLLAAHRKLPGAAWLGKRSWWLKGHIWLGLLSVAFILGHSNYSWGGPLTQALWILFGLVLLTGIVGLVLQNVIPRILTARVPAEAPYDQIPHLCSKMRRRADELVEKICGPVASDDPTPVTGASTFLGTMMFLNTKTQLFNFYEQTIRPFLATQFNRMSPLASKLKAESIFSRLRNTPGMEDVRDDIEQLETLCDERRQLAEQERLLAWLHVWLVVHVPLSVALLVLGVAHVWWTLYY